MAKGILIFDLPEEQVEFWSACHGGKLSTALFTLDQEFRKIVKYQSEGKSEDYIKAIEDAREMLRNVLEDEDLLQALM